MERLTPSEEVKEPLVLAVKYCTWFQFPVVEKVKVLVWVLKAVVSTPPTTKEWSPFHARVLDTCVEKPSTVPQLPVLVKEMISLLFHWPLPLTEKVLDCVSTMVLKPPPTWNGLESTSPAQDREPDPWTLVWLPDCQLEVAWMVSIS